MQLLTVVGAAAVLASSACTVRRAQPDLVGQDLPLTIIHTADLHSRLFPYNFAPSAADQDRGLSPSNAPFGGIARIATRVQQIRASAGRSLWLDSGDSFEGAPVFDAFHGEAELRALTVAGLDGAVLGDHEFARGARNLFDQIEHGAGFPVLAANYAWDDPPPAAAISSGRSLRDAIAPYQIYDAEGLKLGVIGMANITAIPAIYEAGNSLGFRPVGDAAALEPWVRFLRPQVDLVVVISHLGPEVDDGLAASQVDDPSAALALDGVDLILGGHLHIVTDAPTVIATDGLGHDAVVVHSGAYGRYVGRLDLVVHVGERAADPATRSRIASFRYTALPVDSTVADDPPTADVIGPYAVELHQAVDLDGALAYVDPSDGSKIVRADAAGGDSQLGNLVARAMQLHDGVLAQFAITDALGLRADVERGPWTIDQMFNAVPFDRTITVMYLSGVEVQDTLDFVAQQAAARGCRTQVQVAGIAFDLVCRGSCPGGQLACARNISIGDHCRQGGDPAGPIDPARCAALLPTSLYRVAVDDYLAAGGSGFEVLRRNRSGQPTSVSLRDGLRVLLNRQTPCTTQTDETDLGTGNPPRGVVERYGAIACLDQTIEAHDGRIRPVSE